MNRKAVALLAVGHLVAVLGPWEGSVDLEP